MRDGGPGDWELERRDEGRRGGKGEGVTDHEVMYTVGGMWEGEEGKEGCGKERRGRIGRY